MSLSYASLITDATLHMTINAHCGCIDAIHNVPVYASTVFTQHHMMMEKVQNTIGSNKDSENDVRSHW